MLHRLRAAVSRSLPRRLIRVLPAGSPLASLPLHNEPLWRPLSVSFGCVAMTSCYCWHTFSPGLWSLQAGSSHQLPLSTTGCRYWSSQAYDFHEQLLEAVEGQLKTEPETQQRQLQLLRSIASDVSEPSKELIAKLNCEPKLSAEELYKLAVAVFQTREQVGSHGLEIAVSLFECAGEQGDHNALYTYAQLCRTGQGCSPDASRAAAIFTELAMKGHPYAQFALAGMYYSGVGVEQNFTRAFTLYRVSAQNFVPQAYNVIGDMFQHGQGVEENMEEAIQYYKKGAELGDPMAHLSLANCYNHGKGVRKSHENAFEHHLKASESDNPVALYNVGGHYFAGKGVGLSFQKAAEYYRKAADMGFAPAQVNLGNMYYNGLGLPKSRAKAKELYIQAADSDQNAKLLLKELELEEKQQQQQQNGREEDS